MKANELMIGDWVKVKNLCNLFADWHTEKISVCHFYSEAISKFKPIPLTEEVLTLNGFENGILHTEHVDKVVKLVNSKIVNKDGICMWHLSIPSWIGLPIRYVHELQHALRICGLNDIADNFKVN